MIKKIVKYFEGGKPTWRKRSVQILYIVFLIIILSFIPNTFREHFIDSKAEITNLNELSLAKSNREIALFSEFIKQDPELYQDLKFRALEMERLHDQCLVYISELENKLKSVEEKLFFSGSTALWSTNELDSLIHMVHLYRSGLIELTEYQSTTQIDSLLNIKRFIRDTEGNLVALDKYLGSDPQSGLRYLEWLKLKLNSAYATALQSLEKRIVRSYNDSRKHSKIKLPDIRENSSLADFFRHAEKQEFSSQRISKSSELESIKINAQHRSSISLHDLVYYKVNFSKRSENNLSIRVSHMEGDQYFSLDASGDFLYVPQTTGTYSFTFSVGNEIVRDQVYVERNENAVVVNEFQSLFKGLQNEIQITDQLMQFSPDIAVETDNGNWSYSEGKLYVQPSNTGKTSIRIFANMPYGKILLVDGVYDVYDKPLPLFSINGALNGGDIKATNSLNIVLLNDNPSLDQFYIKSFIINVISKSSNLQQSSFYIRGESIDQSVENIVSQLKSGDKLLCDEIEIRNSSGQIFKLAPYVLNIL